MRRTSLSPCVSALGSAGTKRGANCVAVHLSTETTAISATRDTASKSQQRAREARRRLTRNPQSRGFESAGRLLLHFDCIAANSCCCDRRLGDLPAQLAGRLPIDHRKLAINERPRHPAPAPTNKTSLCAERDAPKSKAENLASSSKCFHSPTNFLAEFFDGITKVFAQVFNAFANDINPFAHSFSRIRCRVLVSSTCRLKFQLTCNQIG